MLGTHHGKACFLGIDQVIDRILNDLILRKIPVTADAHINVGAPAYRLQVIFFQKPFEATQPLFGRIGVFRHHLGCHDLNPLVAHVGRLLHNTLQIQLLMDIFCGKAVKGNS